MVVGVIAFLPLIASGQTRPGSLTIKAGVSEIVALSLGSTLPQDNLRIDAEGPPGTLNFTVSGSGTDTVEVRLPVLIRSNTHFNISALVRSQASTLANISVLQVRPMGRFVATDALANLSVAPDLDRRPTTGMGQNAFSNLSNMDSSAPLTILSGPRVSLAGTLNSADNALEVIILIAVKPAAGATSWQLNLGLYGSPRVRF
jgi:hypothetical protein